MEKDTGYLKLILEKAQEARDYVSGYTETRFLSDSKTQSAVIMKLAIIGEISKKVSGEAKTKIDLPWKEIAGFRDMAIHQYLQLSLKIIWATTQESLPELIFKINSYLTTTE